MGVMGLTSYLAARDGARTVANVAAEYKSGGHRLLFAVDGNSLLFFLWHGTAFSPPVDWVYGGSYLQFSYSCEQFVGMLTSIGPICVVFDGASEEIKKATHDRRRAERKKTLEAVAAGERVKDLTNIIPPLAGTILRDVLARNKAVEVVQAPREADALTSVVCRERNAYAVLGEDSDYMCMPSPYVGLSSLRFGASGGAPPAHFDSSGGSSAVLSCLLFEPARTARYLGVRPQDLPLVASLLGNDYLSPSVLRPLHMAVGGGFARKQDGGIISAVASFVARHPDMTLEDCALLLTPTQDLHRIAIATTTCTWQSIEEKEGGALDDAAVGSADSDSASAPIDAVDAATAHGASAVGVKGRAVEGLFSSHKALLADSLVRYGDAATVEKRTAADAALLAEQWNGIVCGVVDANMLSVLVNGRLSVPSFLDGMQGAAALVSAMTKRAEHVVSHLLGRSGTSVARSEGEGVAATEDGVEDKRALIMAVEELTGTLRERQLGVIMECAMLLRADALGPVKRLLEVVPEDVALVAVAVRAMHASGVLKSPAHRLAAEALLASTIVKELAPVTWRALADPGEPIYEVQCVVSTAAAALNPLVVACHAVAAGDFLRYGFIGTEGFVPDLRDIVDGRLAHAVLRQALDGQFGAHNPESDGRLRHPALIVGEFGEKASHLMSLLRNVAFGPLEDAVELPLAECAKVMLRAAVDETASAKNGGDATESGDGDARGTFQSGNILPLKAIERRCRDAAAEQTRPLDLQSSPLFARAFPPGDWRNSIAVPDPRIARPRAPNADEWRPLRMLGGIPRRRTEREAAVERDRLQRAAEAIRTLSRSVDVSVPQSSTHDVRFDRFQREAFGMIDAGRSLIVCAPTGSGKTEVALRAIERLLRGSESDKAMYVCPTKALAHQVYSELHARFVRSLPGPPIAGIVTGDFRIDLDAQVLVTVPEMLEVILLDSRASQLSSLRLAVLDEIHMMSEEDRGPVWERVIMLLPRHCAFVALSATVGSPERLMNWLNSFRSDVAIVTETARKVPLRFYTHGAGFNRLSPYAFRGTLPQNGLPLTETEWDSAQFADAKLAIEAVLCVGASSSSFLRRLVGGANFPTLPATSGESAPPPGEGDAVATELDASEAAAEDAPPSAAAAPSTHEHDDMSEIEVLTSEEALALTTAAELQSESVPPQSTGEVIEEATASAPDITDVTATAAARAQGDGMTPRDTSSGTDDDLGAREVIVYPHVHDVDVKGALLVRGSSNKKRLERVRHVFAAMVAAKSDPSDFKRLLTQSLDQKSSRRQMIVLWCKLLQTASGDATVARAAPPLLQRLRPVAAAIDKAWSFVEELTDTYGEDTSFAGTAAAEDLTADMEARGEASGAEEEPAQSAQTASDIAPPGLPSPLDGAAALKREGVPVNHGHTVVEGEGGEHAAGEPLALPSESAEAAGSAKEGEPTLPAPAKRKKRTAPKLLNAVEACEALFAEALAKAKPSVRAEGERGVAPASVKDAKEIAAEDAADLLRRVHEAVRQFKELAAARNIEALTQLCTTTVASNRGNTAALELWKALKDFPTEGWPRLSFARVVHAILSGGPDKSRSASKGVVSYVSALCAVDQASRHDFYVALCTPATIGVLSHIHAHLLGTGKTDKWTGISLGAATAVPEWFKGQLYAGVSRAVEERMQAEGHTASVLRCALRFGLSHQRAANLESCLQHGLGRAAKGDPSDAVTLMDFCCASKQWHVIEKALPAALATCEDPVGAALAVVGALPVPRSESTHVFRLRMSSRIAATLLNAVAERVAALPPGAVTEAHRTTGIEKCAALCSHDTVVRGALVRLLGAPNAATSLGMANAPHFTTLLSAAADDIAHRLARAAAERDVRETLNCLKSSKREPAVLAEMLGAAIATMPATTDDVAEYALGCLARQGASFSPMYAYAILSGLALRREKDPTWAPSADVVKRALGFVSASLQRGTGFQDGVALKRFDFCVLGARAFGLTLDRIASVVGLVPSLSVSPTVLDSLARVHFERCVAEGTNVSSRSLNSRVPNDVGQTVAGLYESLKARDLLPAIFFVPSRAACEEVTKCLAAALSMHAPPSRSQKSREVVEAAIDRIVSSTAGGGSLSLLLDALRAGVGIHNAGMSGLWRLEVENLFRAGHLQLVVATSTLAVGINMPCRTVVLTRFIEPKLLSVVAAAQMAGRAGRRGFDTLGHVVFAGMNWPFVRSLFMSPLPEVTGYLRSTPSSMLQLASLTDASGEPEDVDRAACIMAHPLFSGESVDRHEQALTQAACSVAVLRWLGLLKAGGAGSRHVTALGEAARHLSYSDPANLFVLKAVCDGSLEMACRAGGAKELLTFLCYTVAAVPYQRAEGNVFARQLPETVEAGEDYDAAAAEASDDELDSGDSPRETGVTLPPLHPALVTSLNEFNAGIYRLAISAGLARRARVVQEKMRRFAGVSGSGDTANTFGGGRVASRGRTVEVNARELHEAFLRLSGDAGAGHGPSSSLSWEQVVQRYLGLRVGAFPFADPKEIDREFKGYILDLVMHGRSVDAILETHAMALGDLQRGVAEFVKFLVKFQDLVAGATSANDPETRFVRSCTTEAVRLVRQAIMDASLHVKIGGLHSNVSRRGPRQQQDAAAYTEHVEQPSTPYAAYREPNETPLATNEPDAGPVTPGTPFPATPSTPSLAGEAQSQAATPTAHQRTRRAREHVTKATRRKTPTPRLSRRPHASSGASASSESSGDDAVVQRPARSRKRKGQSPAVRAAANRPDQHAGDQPVHSGEQAVQSPSQAVYSPSQPPRSAAKAEGRTKQTRTATPRAQLLPEALMQAACLVLEGSTAPLELSDLTERMKQRLPDQPITDEAVKRTLSQHGDMFRVLSGVVFLNPKFAARHRRSTSPIGAGGDSAANVK